MKLHHENILIGAIQVQYIFVLTYMLRLNTYTHIYVHFTDLHAHADIHVHIDRRFWTCIRRKKLSCQTTALGIHYIKADRHENWTAASSIIFLTRSWTKFIGIFKISQSLDSESKLVCSCVKHRWFLQKFVNWNRMQLLIFFSIISELKGLFKFVERTSDVISFYVEQRALAASVSPEPLDCAEEEKYRVIYNFYVRNVSYSVLFILRLWKKCILKCNFVFFSKSSLL